MAQSRETLRSVGLGIPKIGSFEKIIIITYVIKKLLQIQEN